ncbi:MAG TPA: isoprenylcysteine carboxylmethyltransferase family protein [Candidatus Angelobacter sp.]|jgi:protein-S-isoprenylcysteine O-methyltransferase Ste14|nr:isoprenylcysteine carboxylmethyltransferase family protein [Candidatus Angelobacter sp.]
MKLHSILDVVGLAVCSVYCTIPLFWLVFHPFVERWRRHGRRAYMAIIPLWGAFAAVAFALGWPLRHLHLYDGKVPWILGALFILAGFSIYRSASQGFDRAKISGLAELEPSEHDQKLVVTGIRTQVRHPIYLGHLCEVFGWTLGTGSIALCALLVFGAITGAIMIRKEDAELEARFGGQYREYRNRVPALLPKFPL